MSYIFLQVHFMRLLYKNPSKKIPEINFITISECIPNLLHLPGRDFCQLLPMLEGFRPTPTLTLFIIQAVNFVSVLFFHIVCREVEGVSHILVFMSNHGMSHFSSNPDCKHLGVKEVTPTVEGQSSFFTLLF